MDDSYGRRRTSPSRRECESTFRNLMSGTTVLGMILVGLLLAFILYRLLVDVIPMVNMRWRLHFAGNASEDPLRFTYANISSRMHDSNDLVEKLEMQKSKDLHAKTSLLIKKREALKIRPPPR